jgi:adenylate cyclase
MSENPNKLTKLWQELKRRKVFKVVTMYAATAYIIIEVVNNLVGPLHLPEWTATLVVLMLSLGLPIVVILSWIFDFTPEGIKKTESIEEIDSKETETITQIAKKRLRVSDFIVAALMIIVVILAYPKIFNRNSLKNMRSPDGKFSVAIMPFKNMTSDTTWNIWQSGIQNELITSLTNSEELKVRQIETVNSLLRSRGQNNYASITPSVASSISQTLDANVLIYGSINQAGSTIRLNAQLINSKTEDAFKSFQLDGTEENILHTIDSLSVMVKNALIISKLVNELPLYQQHRPSTTSSEAYRYYLYGTNARSKRDYPTARKMFSQALTIDSNFTRAILSLSVTCINEGLWEEARRWSLKAYSKRDQMPIWMRILADKNHAGLFETPIEEIKYLQQYLEIDDQYPGTYYDIGLTYYELLQYDKAIPELEKSLELYKKFDTKPWWIFNYTILGMAYHATGQYNKEKKLYNKADKDFPDDPAIIWQKAILSLTEGDTVTANNYIEKYKIIRKDNSWSEALINTYVASIYSGAGILDKAEEYYRQALTLESENPNRLYNLAYFLIDKDRNINEGMELVDKALELKPDYYWYLDCKGWGLYKQGKYEEALDLLEKSRDLGLYYRQQVQLHIQEVKKAIANQKE